MKILQEMKDPGLGFVTVTEVKLSMDLKTAKVYYSVIGEEEQRRHTSEALTRARAYIRHEIATRMSLKRVPQIEFEYDETPRRAARISELLRIISEEEIHEDR